MRRFMRDIVLSGQQFESDARSAVLFRPVDTFWPECACQANRIDDVPARVSILPFMRIGVKEIAVQGISCELIIETDKTFFPSQLNKDVNDERELGVQIYFLYFRENTR